VNIHDPCVEGSQPSWLPHSEIPGINAETTLHIDAKYHRNMASLHQVNPLVHDPFWKERYASGSFRDVNLRNKSSGYTSSEWWETYALVCNLETDRNSVSGTARNVGVKAPLSATTAVMKKEPGAPQIKSLSELQRACIAVLMSYNGEYGNGSVHRNYIYNPRFLVFDKLCMIVSKESYLITVCFQVFFMH